MPGQKYRYVSVLKQKAGEIAAVAELAPAIWDIWNPFFELLTGDETDNDAVKQKAIHSVVSSCKRGAIVYLDFDDFSQLPAASIVEILVKIEQAQIIPVPVVTLSTDQNVIAAFKNFIATRGSKIGVRIFFNEIDANINANVNQLFTALTPNIPTSDLFVDLEHIPEEFLPALNVAVPISVQQIPELANWASVTLIGAGIPKVLEVPGASNAVLPRTEWELWQNVRIQLSQQVKRLDFGDYTISNPELVDFDPARMQISAKIIYTTDTDWIIYKGRSVRKLGFQQTHAMCAQLILRPEFKGSNFSAGDKYIHDCANQVATCGNSQTWKRVGTNHHITLVAIQLSTQP